ncbi:dermonecrotic toxin domain-containing protein [Pseudomonas sp. CAM1A]|uniref:dermonecrotic toxin domain-containing protein n=1 Tax=Pseudomonas sp. CAM1A TaxID=3231717 RepID=UPI0039C6498A
MNTIKERVERSLDTLDAGRPLAALVDQIVREYPDPYVLANREAARLLVKHTGKAMDPRFVWWHQFESGSSSPLTFNGWKHSQAPVKSMQLAELVIERFDVQFQDAPDQLDQIGGFYRQGARVGQFDERNEIRMLGGEVQKDLWALNFAELYRAAINRFWSTHGQHFRVMAKVNLLGQAGKALNSGLITHLDWQRLRAVAADGLTTGVLPTLALLRQDATHPPLTVSRYAFGEADRGSLYRLTAADGRVVLYMPWSHEAVRGFGSELAMARWLRQHLQSAEALQAFVEGAHANPRDATGRRLIKVHLQGIADSRSDEMAVVALSLFKREPGKALFEVLVDQVSIEMRQTAEVIQSNAALRKAMWRGYLSAFLKVFGGLAPLGWPMSLTLLGVGVGKVGLDVDAAVHAVDEQVRKNALRDAMLDSLYTALNMADIGFTSSFGSLAYEAPPHEFRASLGQWHRVRSATLPVEGLEANALVAGRLAQSGRLRGVRLGNDGSCWITLNGLNYRVRYSHELCVWLIVPQENPFAFTALHPVRLSDQGEWELLEPPRLLGGAPAVAAELPSLRSQLWDTYCREDLWESAKLSTKAIVRQKNVWVGAGVVELAPGQVYDLDARGLPCVLHEGKPVYSYRQGRQFSNVLIEDYTHEASKANDVFRYGTYAHPDMDDYITRLVDTLKASPKNNAVTLYRGGNAARGTGGEGYRSGRLRVGDILVNTDLSSFTENPYKAGEFASTDSGAEGDGMIRTFDDSSVIFEVPAQRYQGGTPISPFSVFPMEAETLFLPGHYFRIEGLQQVYGEGYRFIHVQLAQVAEPGTAVVYDLRTGQPFNLEAYRGRFRSQAVVDRFFPPALTGAEA